MHWSNPTLRRFLTYFFVLIIPAAVVIALVVLYPRGNDSTAHTAQPLKQTVFKLRLQPYNQHAQLPDDAVEQTIRILTSRFRPIGIYTKIKALADGNIEVTLDSQSPEKIEQARQLFAIAGQLHFRPVHENNAGLIARVAELHNGELPLKADAKIEQICPRGYEYMTVSEFQKGKKAQIQAYFVKIRPEMDGKNIKEARPVRDEYNRLRITFTFHEKGAADFARVTEANIGRQLAIVLDGKLYTAPTIQSAIKSGSCEITGQFSDDDAKNIANALQSGKLPCKLQLISVDAVVTEK